VRASDGQAEAGGRWSGAVLAHATRPRGYPWRSWPRTVFQLSQVMWRIISVITSPIIGSTMGAPSATAAALMITPGGDDRVGSGGVTVGDECGALEATAAVEADARGNGVADDADGAGKSEGEEVLGCKRVDDAFDREDAGGNGAGEDGEHDGEAGAALC
jgi:hypothetical protein